MNEENQSLQNIISEIRLSGESLRGLLAKTDEQILDAGNLALVKLNESLKKVETIEEMSVRKDLLNSGVFKHTTNSYKFFWFKAIVELCKKLSNDEEDDKPTFTFQKIFLQMLAEVWYPIQEHRINLGAQDSLGKFIADLSGEFPELHANADVQTLIAKFFTSDQLSTIESELKKNVPYAFLTPFFKKINVRVTDQNGNLNKENVAEQSQKHSNSMPYAINHNENSVTITKHFAKFISSYSDIITNFIDMQLVQFLEKRNPLVPNISMKLCPPLSRDSLTTQTKCWQSFAESGSNNVIDVIDNSTISAEQFDLPNTNENSVAIDHFVPWSFVAHNEMYNLSPLKRSNNNNKSNKIIEDDCIINRFVNQQWAFYSWVGKDKVKAQYLPVVENLGVNEKDFKSLLSKNIHLNMQIALSQGFPQFGLNA